MLQNASQESKEQSKKKWIQFLIWDWSGHGLHSISLNVNYRLSDDYLTENHCVPSFITPRVSGRIIVQYWSFLEQHTPLICVHISMSMSNSLFKSNIISFKMVQLTDNKIFYRIQWISENLIYCKICYANTIQWRG